MLTVIIVYMIPISSAHASFFLAKDWRSRLKTLAARNPIAALLRQSTKIQCSHRLARELHDHNPRSDHFSYTKKFRERKKWLPRRCLPRPNRGEDGPKAMPAPDKGCGLTTD